MHIYLSPTYLLTRYNLRVARRSKLLLVRLTVAPCSSTPPTLS